jgi:hypothetical protein
MKAFPIANMEGDEKFLGMDLRDYFAAKALVIVASQCPSIDFIRAAEVAYDFADAMMGARE